MAIADRCSDATFSLTGEEEAELIKGVDPRATAGLVIRRLARITAQHQEDKAGVEEAWEVNSEGGCGAGNIGKVLPCGSSGGDLVWSGDMGAYSKNDAEVRGSACEYPAEGHT